jgi:hypothetical protein
VVFCRKHENQWQEHKFAVRKVGLTGSAPQNCLCRHLEEVIYYRTKLREKYFVTKGPARLICLMEDGFRNIM